MTLFLLGDIKLSVVIVLSCTYYTTLNINTYGFGNKVSPSI